MDSLCIKCKGRGFCGQPCKILAKFMSNVPQVKTHFSGPSPPEVFVGRIGYPDVNTGILAPTKFETKHSELKDASKWSKNNLSIANILRLRGQLIYGQTKLNIKKQNPIRKITEELALTHKPTSIEFFLKNKPRLQLQASSVFRPMTNIAQIEKAKIEDNIKVLKKVDSLVNDIYARSTTALEELYNSKVELDHLQKLLSVGSLGLKIQRKMVPTRWSITAVDDIISKKLLEKIRYYSEINEILVYSGNYIGNYIEILFLPGKFSFEAIEMWESSSLYSDTKETQIATDHESFYGRKEYASNITGGYYAMKLPITEFLTKIKKQATVLILRRISQEYYAPLGVGIVRETTRRALNSTPKKFETIDKALEDIKNRTIYELDKAKEKSWLLNNYGKQKDLNQFSQKL